MKKPWGGRFRENTRKSVEKFTESLSFDHRLYRYDIQGSIAHANMLGNVGLIGKTDANKIIKGLKAVKQEIDEGKVDFNPAFEDIHMLVEHLLVAKIGTVGKKLHTARSRNDQIATDMKLWMKNEGRKNVDNLRMLQRTLLHKAKQNERLIMPGFTHLQHAQPVFVAFYLLAFIEKFERDISRLMDCLERADELPLGSCALAGTMLPIDRRKTAAELCFGTISRNAMDSVSDRDFLIEYAFILSLIANHISNFCEDMIIWASTEYAYITIDDAYCTGSSIMPQKKNPDVFELLRGKTARVCAALYALLTLTKGLPQAYNRDLQEDKERIFDAHDTVLSSVSILCELIIHTHFNESRLFKSIQKGFMEATALAEYMVARGVFFRDAHQIAGEIVRIAEAGGKRLTELGLEEMKRVCPKIDEDVYSVLSCENIPNQIASTGGTGRNEIGENLKYWQMKLSDVDPDE